jgi:hypothetical protein
VALGEKLSRVVLRLCTILNFDISLGRAAFGKNFDIDRGRVTLRRNFDVNIGRAA